MSIEKGNKKEKNQNIQVFVRLRPINNRERELKSMGVVEVAGSKDVIVKMVPLESKLTKKFSFDRAFGPNSKQVEVYHEVVSPLIEEVLSGYNCTVFAYGQTGTGKTHTMVGESSSNGDVPWQNDPMAGIIPRALSQLFDELRITNSEFTVRVSYLELYNEELFDLLSSSEDNSKLRIYEDVTRKGSNIVNGLEEVTVYNKNEVYKIMAKGQEKRKIASTLMNAQSSRSHTVFTIVVHMKENSSEGEELMKIGKLNLVDLAGSENISKAGSDNPARKERARECVNINQSLLTLGRVITALVERHPHIPYRESKLTRLLQESLGGRTKTSIIATISPGHKDVEETLSTLDYAYRARCIQNKPEVNQRITKHAVLKEFSEEIDRLKRDLLAARERNGVYISNDSYTDMTLKLEEQTKEIQEQILYIKAMKEEKDKIEALFNEMEENLKVKEKQLQRTNAALDNAKDVIQVTKKDLVNSQMECDEQKELVSKRQATEAILSEQAHKLLRVADATTTDVHCLHNTVEKKKALEVTNLEKVKEFGEKSHSHRAQMKEQLDAFKKEQSDQLQTLQEVLDQQIKACRNNQNDGKDLLNNLLGKITEAVSQSSAAKEQYVKDFTEYSDDKLKAMKDTNEKHKRVMEDNMREILGVLQQVQDDRDKQLNSALQMLTFVQQWKDVFSVKVQNMHKMQEELWQQCTSHLTSMATEFEQQHSATLNDMDRVAKERSSHQEDMFSRLKQLKRALEELEEKSLSMSTRISTEEEDCRRAFEARGEAFSTILKDGKTNLDTASGNMKAATQEVETSHEGFLKDVVVINQEHVDRIRSAAKTEEKLGDLLTALPAQYEDICAQQNAGVEEGYQQTLHKVTEVLNDQQSCHANALQECHTDGAGVVVPMDATLKELDECWQSSRAKIEDVQKNLDGYTHNMNDSLSVTHTIENRLLKEEYKLYSPTGKTPVRREFSYPRELAATSPHERILRRFRNLRDGVQSPQNHSVINLDQTTEDLIVPTIDVTNQSSDAVCISSPEHESTNISASDVNNSKIASSEQRTKAFLEPTRLPPRATPKHTPRTSPLTKSTSDSDIYALTHAESDSKENLNNTTDRKESKSRLRPPSQKKVLANRNY